VSKRQSALLSFMKAVNGMMVLLIIYALFFLWLYWTYQI
jgi:hypothetical protein